MDAGIVVTVFLLLLSLSVFILPGFGWVTWLHRRDEFGWPFRLVLGFAWSFVLFSLLGAPFLWLGGNFTTFLHVLFPVWAVFGCVGLAAYRRAGRAKEPQISTGPLSESASDTGSKRATKTINSPRKTPAIDAWVWVLGGFYVAVTAMAVLAWTGFLPNQEYIDLLQESPILLLGTGGLAWTLRRRLAPIFSFTPEDELPPARAWTALVVAVILVQSVAAMIYFRPDWDDCFYLMRVLDYQYAERLNYSSLNGLPTLAPEQATHRLLCLELWGAVLCHISGADVQALFHTFLPGFFVLAVYGAYSGLLGRIIPRRWTPLAILGLAGYFAFGICGPYDGANHFLIRIWQGKALLLHLAVPLTAASLMDFAESPRLHRWLSLLVCVALSIGLSSSALFLEGALIVCLTVALLPSVSKGRLGFAAGAALALAPLAAFAAAVLLESPATNGVPQISADQAADQNALSSWKYWASAVLNNSARGSADVLWFACLPLLAVMLWDRRRLAYPVFFPAVLMLTFANPWLSHIVSAKLTSLATYYRILWLFPIGVGLSVVLALGGRLAAAAVANRMPTLQAFLPVAVVSGGVLLLAILPGTYVWGPKNAIGSFMTPDVGRNLEKMPPDLKAIAILLEQDPDVERGNILCGEEVTTFFTPRTQKFHYAVVRPLYTLTDLAGRGQYKEFMERYFLLQVAHHGILAQAWQKYDVANVIGYAGGRTNWSRLVRDAPMLKFDDLPSLMDQYRVRYIVTSPPKWLKALNIEDADSVEEYLLRERTALLQRIGFREVYHGDDYSLWKR